jgi:hypothetical protein
MSIARQKILNRLFWHRLKDDKDKNREETSAVNCTEEERYAIKHEFFSRNFTSDNSLLQTESMPIKVKKDFGF